MPNGSPPVDRQFCHRTNIRLYGGGIRIAINKAVLAALKALSYPDIDIKKNYPLVRSVKAAAGRPISPFYKPWDHVVVSNGHEVPVRLFSPDGEAAGRPVLLFFHGGGWVTGDIDSYDRVCHHMARLTGRLVVSVDYRLAPEYPFPAGLEDCYAVAKEIYLDAGSFGLAPEQITLIGDSAGGNLAAAVSLLARDRGEFLPKQQILLYPAVYNDHSPASPFASVQENGADYLLTSKRVNDYMALYASCPEDRSSPYFAPLLAPELSGLPRTLVITAQYDPLRDEGEAFARALAHADVPTELHRMRDALHGFLALPPHFSHVKRAYEWINGFLNEGELL